MMKQYHIYVFTKDDCAPCTRLKEHVATLTDAEQAELDFVPIHVATGQRTALAEEFNVAMSPTLVVTHTDLLCEIDYQTDEEFCDQEEQTVERFVGASNIIEHLQATLDAYTYAHPE